MPDFATPFSCKKSDRKLTKEEIIRAIRFSIASEYEAIQLYELLAESTDNADVKILLEEVASDEKVHVGNFSYLLNMLSSSDEKFLKEGEDEAKDIISKS